MGWTGVERWRGKTPHGTEWHVTLAQLEALGPFPGGAWRVEWWQAGHAHTAESFPAEREHDARAFCATKRDELPVVEWENLSGIDITRPKASG